MKTNKSSSPGDMKEVEDEGEGDGIKDSLGSYEVTEKRNGESQFASPEDRSVRTPKPKPKKNEKMAVKDQNVVEKSVTKSKREFLGKFNLEEVPKNKKPRKKKEEE